MKARDCFSLDALVEHRAARSSCSCGATASPSRMIVGIPIMQLALFGFAINTDPKHLPTAVIVADQSEFTRSFVAAMKNSDYFDFVDDAARRGSRPRARSRSGEVQFVLDIPVGLHARPAARRASVAAGRGRRHRSGRDRHGAGGAAATACSRSPTRTCTGRSRTLAGGQPPFDVQVHRLYNPEGITQYNIVPGLMGVILTMTHGDDDRPRDHARARARHDGKPARDAGAAARGDDRQDRALHLHRPGAGDDHPARRALRVPRAVRRAASSRSICAALLFIAANLTVGITLSSLAQNQLQAMQLTLFYFLPNILLSGFMFPFAGHAALGAVRSATCCRSRTSTAWCAASC